jgi:hypothetical protein
MYGMMIYGYEQVAEQRRAELRRVYGSRVASRTRRAERAHARERAAR